MCSKSNLSRSRSTGSLDFFNKSDECRRLCGYRNDNHRPSESSCDISVIADDRSNNSSLEDRNVGNAAAEVNVEILSQLEHKINKLSDIVDEQHNVLKSLKEELITSKVVLNTFAASDKSDFVKDSNETVEELGDIVNECANNKNQDNGDRNLWNALERSQVQRTDREIKNVLNTLLQNDELKECITTATVSSIREAISATFSETFPAACLPVLEQAHGRLLQHVTTTLENAFRELEAKSEGLLKSVHSTSSSLRTALEKHEALLENVKTGSIFDNFQNSLESILKNELKEWREKLAIFLVPEKQEGCYSTNMEPDSASDVISYLVSSPPQRVDSEYSIIDHLMISAKIRKSIMDGEIDKSFEEALSSLDLSLVVAACKAADPAKIFGPPCSLKQSVLLSLIQQLVTDMVNDTQLKCRYLEYAIKNLNTADQTTRAHFPLVVGEVRRHLFKFIKLNPSHVANRRINLIIMAATNLLHYF